MITDEEIQEICRETDLPYGIRVPMGAFPAFREVADAAYEKAESELKFNPDYLDFKVVSEGVIPKDIEQVIAKIRKLDVEQRKLQTTADQILSSSGVGQAPPVYHSTLDKTIKITKKKAELWNTIRGKIIPGIGRTLWQQAIKETLPTVNFGMEEHLDFFAEDIEKLFRTQKTTIPKAE